jgi:hypothetical protein
MGKLPDKLYVVAEKKAGFTDNPKSRIWTLSPLPEIPGWETDGGYPDYGLRKERAIEIARRYNLHEEMLSALMTIKDLKMYADEEGYADLTFMGCEEAFEKVSAAIEKANGKQP